MVPGSRASNVNPREREVTQIPQATSSMIRYVLILGYTLAHAAMLKLFYFIRAPELHPQSSSTLFANASGVSVEGGSFQTFSGVNINVNVETGRK